MLLESISSVQQRPTIFHLPSSTLLSSNKSETVASPRASLRRLRTETNSPRLEETSETSTEPSLNPLIDQLARDFADAIDHNRYEDAIRILDTIENLPESTLNFPEEMRPFYPLFIAGVEEMKAYFTAMLHHPDDALQIHTQAMEKIAPFRPTLDAMFGSKLNLVWEHLAAHQGLFLLLNQKTTEAIPELQKAGQTTQDPFLILLLGAIQKKLGVQIIQYTETTDRTNPESLFYAGRYEEALKWLDESSLDCSDDEYIRGACYAMLGRMDEALACFDTEEGILGRKAVHLMQGDFTAAREMPDLSSDEMPLYHMVSIPIQLAIEWMENYSATN